MDWAAQQRLVGSVSPVLIHRGDSLHFRVCQLKVENVKVLGNVRFIAGTGKRAFSVPSAKKGVADSWS